MKSEDFKKLNTCCWTRVYNHVLFWFLCIFQY